MLTDLLLGGLLNHPVPPAQDGNSCNSLGPAHQLLIKKILRRLACRPVLETFSQLRSLFQDVQVCVKLTKTTSTVLPHPSFTECSSHLEVVLLLSQGLQSQAQADPMSVF